MIEWEDRTRAWVGDTQWGEESALCKGLAAIEYYGQRLWASSSSKWRVRMSLSSHGHCRCTHGARACAGAKFSMFQCFSVHLFEENGNRVSLSTWECAIKFLKTFDFRPTAHNLGIAFHRSPYSRNIQLNPGHHNARAIDRRDSHAMLIPDPFAASSLSLPVVV